MNHYQVLLPMSALMSRADTEDPAQHCGVRLFDKKSFESAVQTSKWDRVRLFVRQQYRTDVCAVMGALNAMHLRLRIIAPWRLISQAGVTLYMRTLAS